MKKLTATEQDVIERQLFFDRGDSFMKIWKDASYELQRAPLFGARQPINEYYINICMISEAYTLAKYLKW